MIRTPSIATISTSAPLVKAIPGLPRFETGRLDGALDGGEQPHHPGPR